MISARKPRIEAFDYMKAIAACIIIFTHYEAEAARQAIGTEVPGLVAFKNGSWGELAVTMFFLTAGALSVYHHPRIEWKDLGSYYFKRFKALFPSYYLVWLFFYLTNVLNTKNFFYVQPASKILLSFIGMDGYFMYYGDNYYATGDWFFGPIVLLYLLYPFAARLFEKRPLRIPVEIALVLGTLWVYHTDVFRVYPFRNLITCLLSFWTGMLLITVYKRLLNAPAFIVSIVLTFIGFFVYVNRWPKGQALLELVLSAAIFILLACACEHIPKVPVLSAWAGYTSGICLQMFLLQHLIIWNVLPHFAGGGLRLRRQIWLLLAIYIAVYFFADVLNVVTKNLLERIGKWKKSLSSRREKKN